VGESISLGSGQDSSPGEDGFGFIDPGMIGDEFGGGANGRNSIKSNFSITDNLSLDLVFGFRVFSPVSYNDIKGKMIYPGGQFGDETLARLRGGFVHTGVDFPVKNVPIYSTAFGIVKYADNTNGPYGFKIIIDHGFGITTIYNHLERNLFTVKKGDFVVPGQQIAISGNSSTNRLGYHLDYEVKMGKKFIDPTYTLPRIIQELYVK